MTRLWLPIGCVLGCGCGRLDFEHARDAAIGADAADAAPELGMFGPAEQVTELFDAVEQTTNPAVSADEREIYFVRRVGGQAGEIYVARRPSTAGLFGSIAPVTELNAAEDDAGIHLARDGMTMWLSSGRLGGPGTHDIYSAAREMTGFGVPALVPTLSSPAEDNGPTVDDRQLHVAFSIGPPLARDLWQSQRATIGDGWDPAEKIVELSSTADDLTPELSPDGLTIYFTSDRDGNLDLYTARRSSLAVPFGAPTRIAELATEMAEVTPWISADGRTLYFASNRDGRFGIYRARR